MELVCDLDLNGEVMFDAVADAPCERTFIHAQRLRFQYQTDEFMW